MRLTLKYKLLFWFISFSIVSLLFIIPFNLLFFRNREQVNDTAKKIDDLHFYILNKRNYQSQFLIYDAKSEFYFSERKSNNLDNYHATVKKINELSDLLRSDMFLSNKSLEYRLRDIKSMDDSCNYYFDAIEQLIFERGFKDEGLIGRMRASIHFLENTPGTDLSKILMIRRHEKDYMLRNDSVYIRKLIDLTELYINELKITTQFPVQKRDTLVKSLNSYRNDFLNLVESDKKIGVRENDGYTFLLANCYTKLDGLIFDLIKNVNSERSKYFIAMKSYYLVYSLLIFMFCVFISFYLAKIITKPIKLLTDTIIHFKNGQFSKIDNIQINGNDLEFKFLFEEFLDLLSRIQLREKERDAAEENLRYNEHRYRELAELLPISLFETDDMGYFNFVNKTWYEVFGYTESDLRRGIHMFDLMRCEDGTSPNFDILQTETILRAKLANGMNIPVILYSNNIVMNNKKIGWRGIIIDHSEREKYIKALKDEKNRAENADKLKTAFLSNMSHEIRTPMNAIIGFSSLIEDKELHVEKRSDYIKLIQASGQQLLGLINDIIDISKIEAGMLAINISVCKVNEFMEDIFNTYKMGLLKNINHNVEMKLLIDAEQDSMILMTDVLRLRQVLVNLLNNAIKFTHKGYVELGYKLKSGKILFYVKDTGIGIPDDMKDNVFKRFMQVDHGLNRSYQGTGLGLTISKNLVELLGGTISVESVVGKGSTFYCEFEKSKELKNTEKKVKPVKINKLNSVVKKFESFNVLIAEDNDINYRLIHDILEVVGITIIRAVNGIEVLDKLRAVKSIDMIIMDMNMPEVNGFEATQIIRQTNSDLPIIACTAYALDIEKERCLEVGCNDYIPKPIDQEHLLMVCSNYYLGRINKENSK